MNNEIKINVPEGMEIDKENSTFECIKFKPKWTPKRGDIVTTGGSNPQIILVAEYIKLNSIIGFDIKPLALLSKNGLSIYIKDSFIPTLWVKEKASASEKELLIDALNKKGYVYDPNDPRVIYKKEKELPKTWKEFCDNNPIKDGEFFIDDCSEITEAESGCRSYTLDANSLPSEEYAEAMLALCKLIQLRDCYNDGWKPDWKNASPKHIIRVYSGLLITDTASGTQGLLTFKTPMLRDVFLNNFRDLIEQAKLLL